MKNECEEMDGLGIVMIMILCGALAMLTGCGEIWIGHSYYGRVHHERNDVSMDSEIDETQSRRQVLPYERKPRGS